MNTWRKQINFEEPLHQPTVEEALLAIQLYLADHPFQGERMLQGYLRANKGWWIRRSDLREIIKLVDVDGSQRRLKWKIRRRVYNGVAPGYIWHIDTHHKIGKFGFVTFGAVDGFTHQIMSLSCCNNNQASTLLNAFINSPMVQQRSLPIFIRGDGGLENASIAKLINSVSGTNHFISGRSVHNQRVERMWRDVFTNVIGYYKNHLETITAKYDIELTDNNIWIIQSLYLDGINEELRKFQLNWNSHSMRSELNNVTPNGKELLNTNSQKYSPQRNLDNPKVKTYVSQLKTLGSYSGKKTADATCPFDKNVYALKYFNDNLIPIRFEDTEDEKTYKLLFAFDLCNYILLNICSST